MLMKQNLGRLVVDYARSPSMNPLCGTRHLSRVAAKQTGGSVGGVEHPPPPNLGDADSYRGTWLMLAARLSRAQAAVCCNSGLSVQLIRPDVQHVPLFWATALLAYDTDVQLATGTCLLILLRMRARMLFFLQAGKSAGDASGAAAEGSSRVQAAAAAAARGSAPQQQTAAPRQQGRPQPQPKQQQQQKPQQWSRRFTLA
jgi:hypothetical protein